MSRKRKKARMRKLHSFTDVVHVKDKFLDSATCKKYIHLARKPSIKLRSSYSSVNNQLWEERVVDITNDPIVLKVKEFLDAEFGLNLQITRAQIQNWIKGSNGGLHRHYPDPSTYNSLIYLNTDFKGGVFFTSCGVVVNAEVGRLTFFNGKKVFHGVSEVEGGDRFTLIFFWRELREERGSLLSSGGKNR